MMLLTKGEEAMSVGSVQIRQNGFTAALLVFAVTSAIWIVFNSFVEAYPPRPNAHQTPSLTTSTTTQKLGYPYRFEP